VQNRGISAILVSLRAKRGNLVGKMHFFLKGLPRRYAPRNDTSISEIATLRSQ
jgi:hypothetical protein